MEKDLIRVLSAVQQLSKCIITNDILVQSAGNRKDPQKDPMAIYRKIILIKN